MNSRTCRDAFVVGLCAVLLTLGGCGGGSGSGSTQSIQNTQPAIVDAGPANTTNILFVSVTICAPGSSVNCQTIDHIQVDTGSSGLRILASVLNSAALSLPVQTDAAGSQIVECLQFVDGYSWGPVRLADIKIAGESAGSVPIQVIGDPAYSNVPANCSSSGPSENTVADFGANGIVGLGYFLQDCGAVCVTSAIPGAYYVCPSSSTCQPTALALAKQVPNPVALFGSDNNGVIIDLPAISPTGAATTSGSLIFGIGTQSDNALGTAKVISVNAQTGNVLTVYNGQSYPNSFFDSGSSVIFFGTNIFPLCTGSGAGLYCPVSLQALSATIEGTAGLNSTVNFSVANSDTLFSTNPNFTAFNDIAAPNSDPTGFAWGLSFFYGRRIYTAFEGKSTSGGNGPYVAY
jgi:hypothetical protein